MCLGHNVLESHLPMSGILALLNTTCIQGRYGWSASGISLIAITKVYLGLAIRCKFAADVKKTLKLNYLKHAIFLGENLILFLRIKETKFYVKLAEIACIF